MNIRAENGYRPIAGDDVFVHKQFERQAQETPDAIAVQFGSVSVTYTELNKRADRLSVAIRIQSPVSRIIGISSSRNIDMLVGVIAILKAGRAYLPLDPAYPGDRLQQTIEDAGIDACICPPGETALFTAFGLTVILPRDEYIRSSKEQELDPARCYVLYTSGSTGKPKGVCMGHKALLNLMNWQKKHSGAGLGTRTLQFAPLSFDVSFQEIFCTLSTAGILVLIHDDLRLDPNRLLHFIEEQSINRLFLPFVALQYLTEAAEAGNFFPSSLQEIMTAGEQLKITPQVVRFFSSLPLCTLYNQYGPTECHVVSNIALTGDAAKWPALPSIGKPIDNTGIHMLDEYKQEVADGEIGELCISGDCLAEGYLNRPELTAEKFIYWKQRGKPDLRLYLTGDLARRLPDGNIEFLGRRDDQVKIRGYRIEPGEIEVALNHQPGIQQSAVMAREDIPGQKRLVAYLVSSSQKKDTESLRKAIEKQLPDYMIPSAFVWLDAFPKTTSGKIDRKSLPKPEIKRPDLSVLYTAPSGKMEQQIADLWIDLLQLDKVGVHDNFFELGGNSLLAVKTVASLKQKYNYDLPITKIYQFPSIHGVAGYLSGGNTELLKPVRQKKKGNGNQDIAVIGMAGRFPGADTIEALWTLLKEGRESISFFNKAELDPFLNNELVDDPDYVRARGILNDAAGFDPAFFGINPKLAELMDPQQRIFLEIAWEVLESTGYLAAKYQGSIAVFAGSGNNSYYLNNVLSNQMLVERMGAFQVMTFNEKDYIASRTAYELDLHGPAVSVHSGCSTSLLAVAQAVQSIRDGQCDLALAGGASVTAPVKSGHLYQDGAMLSNDGHCRSFDADAKGTVFSDGAGIVLLKSKEAAIEDGDTIYAVIKGIGVNNDGGGKGSFTAPSAGGQAGAIRMALENGGIDPSGISYVEAHGTATPVGDPIEIEGLTLAFGKQDKKQYCALGSIKSNMGHLTAAAGVAGFIKTVLALHHQQIPASIHFKKPNPNIDFENSPFFINAGLRDWKADGIRRAGVSSFGVGGTNVHIVLEESENAEKKSSKGRGLQLISWSAKTAKSREAYAGKLKEFIGSNPSIHTADLAYTLQTTRKDFANRRFILASGNDELLEKLTPAGLPASETRQLEESLNQVVFMFPGQGSQYINMGREFYEQEAVFRNAVDECAKLLEPILKEDIRKVIYTDRTEAELKDRINNTYYTQPAIFVIEYALAKLWISWGIQPAAFIGHSIGEFVAAHLAGIFSLEDGIILIAHRGRMMSELPGGSMLSVRTSHQQVGELLPAAVSIAAINSPNLSVVAGPFDAIAGFSKKLDELGIANKLLQTSHAFHSSMMDPVTDPFEKKIRAIKLNLPRIPIVSTVTGKWLTDAEAINPAYWAQHLRSTVRFSAAVNTLLEDGFRLMLETGPRNVTATLVRQHGSAKTHTAFSSLDPIEGQSEYYSLLKAMGQLWLHGITPDWKAFYAGQQRLKVDLPSYAFDRIRCWVDPPVAVKRDLINATAPVLVSGAAQASTEENHLSAKLMRKDVLIDKLKEILENASGIEMDGVTPDMSFIEMGLDSLLLTQISLNLKKEFSIPVTFRQLNEQYGSLASLAAYLDAQLPQDRYQAVHLQNEHELNGRAKHSATPGNENAINLISQQIQLLSQQVALLSGGNPGPVPVKTNTPAAIKPVYPDLTPDEITELKKPFGATARIERQVSALSAEQEAFLAAFTVKYNAKTNGSKNYTQQHRSYMADPRVVSGFKPLTKEIVYPIVVNKSKGCYLWDIDGNEYIDVLNGFGSNLLGYQNDTVKEAIHAQIERGYELGPQHELAGVVCKLICEFTQTERSALCNTGSEAVLGAMRIARTVTGRSLIVAFSGSYHGIVDEVIVRGTKKLKSFPAAPGIMPEAVQNMLILDYGTDESLKIIAERAHELAAVMVEPVQSRRPEFQPVEFLRKLRDITEASGTVLVFDEVITGFRMHPAGTQGLFGIQADIGTYGKVIAGGMPIGVIAGKKQYMDALDGGFWKFGDASTPEAGVTYFAGTFVRHPLALAASKASLEYMKEKGPSLQQDLTAMTKKLADALNGICRKNSIPLFVAQFGSLFKLKFKEDFPYSELLFTLMREKGIHIWDGFPCFLTAAHTNKELDCIIAKFEESIKELLKVKLIPVSEKNPEPEGKHRVEELAPFPGAKLGRDKEGNPAWFIADPNRPGKYLQVN